MTTTRGCCCTRLRVDKTERVDDDLALDGLDWVDDDGDISGVQLLEGLLRVAVGAGQPAAEPRVAVVPPDHRLGAARQLQARGTSVA